MATRPPNQRLWFDGWMRIGLCWVVVMLVDGAACGAH